MERKAFKTLRYLTSLGEQATQTFSFSKDPHKKSSPAMNNSKTNDISDSKEADELRDGSPKKLVDETDTAGGWDSTDEGREHPGAKKSDAKKTERLNDEGSVPKKVEGKEISGPTGEKKQIIDKKIDNDSVGLWLNFYTVLKVSEDEIWQAI